MNLNSNFSLRLPLALTLAALSPLGLSLPVLAEVQSDPVTQVADDQLGIVSPRLPAPEQVEICFVLDTTGSMAGLIDAARRKIWTIANHIVQHKPNAEIRFALIGYRDRGDDYITTLTPLTDDLDNIQGQLNQFSANGGNDQPESVNQALHEALSRVNWSPSPQTHRIIFVVGDAPPHTDYANDVSYQQSCGEARQRGIRINTIQCGNISETTPFWAEIAQLGGGRFVQIPQDGNARVITCPQDAEIAQLSQQLNQTVLAYGDAAERKNATDQVTAASELAAAAPEAAASRSSVNSSFDGGLGRAITGRGDLLAQLQSGEAELGDLDRSKLGAEFAELSDEQLRAEVAERQQTRNEIQEKIKTLAAARNAFLAEAEAAAANGAEANSFDGEVRQMIESQLAEPLSIEQKE